MSTEIGSQTPTHQQDKDEVASGAKGKAQDAEPQTNEDQQQTEQDRKLAQQIADIVASALDRVKPITAMIQQVFPHKWCANDVSI